MRLNLNGLKSLGWMQYEMVIKTLVISILVQQSYDSLTALKLYRMKLVSGLLTQRKLRSTLENFSGPYFRKSRG